MITLAILPQSQPSQLTATVSRTRRRRHHPHSPAGHRADSFNPASIRSPAKQATPSCRATSQMPPDSQGLGFVIHTSCRGRRPAAMSKALFLSIIAFGFRLQWQMG